MEEINEIKIKSYIADYDLDLNDHNIKISRNIQIDYDDKVLTNINSFRTEKF